MSVTTNCVDLLTYHRNIDISVASQEFDSIADVERLHTQATRAKRGDMFFKVNRNSELSASAAKLWRL